MSRKILFAFLSIAITFVSVAVVFSGCGASGGTGVDTAVSIAFARWENGGSDIYLKNHLSIVDVDVNLTNLPAGRNMEPAWSPDNTTIAFVSMRDGNFEIYTMNRDGSNVVRLTNNIAIDMSPSFSPDGTRIAFISSRSGRNLSVFTMKTDGTDVVQVTDNPGADATPCWSPDSLFILFVSSFENTDGTNRLYLIGANRSNQHRLTGDAVDEGDPDWNPVTNRIVYQRSDAASGSQIYRVNADGTVPVRLTDGLVEHEGWHATWSPDGMNVVFVSSRDGEPQLYTMSSDGTGVTRLTQTTSVDGQPAWGIAD
jgi:TolB protein